MYGAQQGEELKVVDLTSLDPCPIHACLILQPTAPKRSTANGLASDPTAHLQMFRKMPKLRQWRMGNIYNTGYNILLCDVMADWYMSIFFFYKKQQN